METITLDGTSLTLIQVYAIAYGQPDAPRVEISAQATRLVTRAADAVQTLLERGVIAYGITTGFGAFKNRIIWSNEVEQLQHNILVSHSVGVGDPFDVPTTRAIMLIRANTLARGHSGIRLSTLQLLVDMLNAGVHPIIPEKGSLGASGDLAPLAHMALPIIGEGLVNYQGKYFGGRSIQTCGVEVDQTCCKEGLALTNGTSVMTALGVLQTLRAERYSQTADIAGCLSLEALNGTDLAFDSAFIIYVRIRARKIVQTICEVC